MNTIEKWAICSNGCGKALDAEQCAALIERCCDVDVEVRVDAPR